MEVLSRARPPVGPADADIAGDHGLAAGELLKADPVLPVTCLRNARGAMYLNAA